MTTTSMSVAPPAPTPQCVELSRWSDARLAAQTVIVPVTETDVSTVGPEVSDGAGGVILFGSAAPANLGVQVVALNSRAPARLRPVVMTDEEGGGVQQMANLVGSLPWARFMGATWTPAYITSQVAVIARRMASFGITMDLAPVVDVDGRDVPPGSTDPDGWRSFSSNTSVVTQDGLAFARGLEQGGVVPVSP
jgi:beta-N-acetylhexosaminidase